jgi:hypothetical protein
LSLTIDVVGGTLNSHPETTTPGSFSIGLNVSGMEYGGAGAVANYNYVVPTLNELQYYHAQGQDLIRLPISWTTLQPSLNGPLDSTYLSNIENVLSNAASLGMKVIVDIHDYGAYNGNDIGTSAVTDADFANLWKQLSSALAGKPGLGGYDLMNEPNNMPSATAWTDAAQAAITAIRTVDMSTPIYVEGNHWANSYDWSTVNPGFTTLNDPANNLIFEAHVYLDSNDSGTNYDWSQQASLGVTTDTGVQRLQDFVTWLQTNHLKGMVGEVGVGNDNSDWLTALDNTLNYAQANNLATTYWAAGAWWGNYPMSVEPQNGVNAPQMAVLDKYSGNYPTVSVATVTGQATAGSTIYLSENDVLLTTTTANSTGGWSYTLTGLSNGIHIIVAGNTPPGVDGTISATVFNLESGQNTGNPICYTPGTRILTPTGEKSVEDLRSGDIVVSRLKGFQPIKWIGRQSYDPSFLSQDKLPVQIAAGTFGPNMPTEALSVSPGHSILLGEKLILAKNLINGVNVIQPEATKTIEYYALELDEHDCVCANGIWAESFADGPGLRTQFHNRATFLDRFPDYIEPDAVKLCAIRPESGVELEEAILPIIAHLNITPGPLWGYVEQIGPEEIIGWAWDAGNPDVPVLMEIWADDEKLGNALACHHRVDLTQAGLGRGHCMFSFIRPTSPIGIISVRRASDGTILPRHEACQAAA